MARAYGYDAQLLMKRETAYATDPTGNYDKMPFISCDYIAADQPHLEDDQLNTGRDPKAPAEDVQRVAFQVVVPLDVRNIGKWLRQVFGAPTTTGTNPYTHTFVSGAAALSESCSIELGLSQVPAYYMKRGSKCNSLQLGVGRGNLPQATLQFMARSEVQATSSGGGTPPAQPTYTRFKFFEGKIQRSGSDLANVLGGDLDFNNNLIEIPTIRADELIENFDPGVTRCAGNIQTRFAATTLYDDAAAQTGLAIKYVYTIDANNSLTFTVHEARLPITKQGLSGPGGVEYNTPFLAANNAAAGEMLEVVLVNDVASY